MAEISLNQTGDVKSRPNSCLLGALNRKCNYNITVISIVDRRSISATYILFLFHW